MRVAFFSHYSGLYGANTSLLSLTQGLRPRGVDPLVFLPKKGSVEHKLRQNNTAYRISAYSTWLSKRWSFKNVVRKALGNLVLSGRLAKNLQSLGISLVHSNSSVTNFGALVASRLKVPHVWHVREFGDMDYGLRPEWGKRLFMRSLVRADAVVFISETLKQHFCKSNRHANAHVISNPIASREEFARRRGESIERLAAKPSGTPFTFILVGLIQPQKGQEIAIRAFHRAQAMNPNLRLWLVGSGSEPYLQHCQAVARELGVLSKVVFWGYTDNPNQLYCEADCGLMCSQSEAFGRVTAESMSFCLPVIGFRGGATPELIKPEETGLLYSGAEDELTACMLKMATTPNWARELGEKAFLFVSERFTLEAHTEAVFALYSQVMATSSLQPHGQRAGQSKAVCSRLDVR